MSIGQHDGHRFISAQGIAPEGAQAQQHGVCRQRARQRKSVIPAGIGNFPGVQRGGQGRLIGIELEAGNGVFAAPSLRPADGDDGGKLIAVLQGYRGLGGICSCSFSLVGSKELW